jgi:hypothetical protein
MIQACKEYGLTATVEGNLDLKQDLTQMIDGYSGQEHSLPIMPLYKDVIEFMARTKTFCTPRSSSPTAHHGAKTTTSSMTT